MGKDYFREIEFEPPKAEKAPEANETLTYDVKPALKKFDEEVVLMEMGQSQYRARAVYFPKGKAPFKNAQTVFAKNPTLENRSNFLAMVAQDLGKTASDFVESLLEEAKNG